jgi:hypothetical protein
VLTDETQAIVDRVKVTHQIGNERRCLQCGATEADLKAAGEKTVQAR